MFGFGQRHETRFDGTMRLAFCVDGLTAHAAVHLVQAHDGAVHGTIDAVAGDASRDAVIRQVARVLSLDHDATEYEAIATRDRVLAPLFAAAPGLRPPLFYSPYEAALWSVISARRPAHMANVWRAKLSARAGARFEVAGQEAWSVPLPHRLIELEPRGVAAATGVEATRAERIVAVARAAAMGELDADELRAMPLARATRHLRTIPGIGPFYASLILIRAIGATDILPDAEPKLQALVGELYALGRPATPDEMERIARPWAPFRTWAAVLIRAAAHRRLS